MIEIIPAILEPSFEGIEKKLAQVRTHAKWVQIDICDGSFVPSLTWPFVSPPLPDKPLNLENGLREMVADEKEMVYWEDFDFELHLMVSEPKKLFPNILIVGPSRVLFHIESFSDAYNGLFDVCKLLPTIVEPGIAVNIDTNLEILFEILDDGIVTFVQCMGIAHDGSQGQLLDERVFKNIEILHARYPKLPISVDGGVTLENAKRLVDAGATRLVVGSAIFTAENIPARIAEFKKVVQ